MAIRVLKAPPKSEPKEVECKECRSLLSYLPSDVKIHEGDGQREPDYATIGCPTCGDDVIVPMVKAWEIRRK